MRKEGEDRMHTKHVSGQKKIRVGQGFETATRRKKGFDSRWANKVPNIRWE